MHTQSDFPVANTADSQPYTIDFINDLPEGQTVVGADVTLTLFSGTDPSPSSHMIGSFFITGDTMVSQVLRGLLPGNIYSLNIVATASSGYTMELYALIPCAAVYS